MLCLLAFLAAPPQGDVIPARPAVVEVREGRARLLGEGGGQWLSATDPAAVTHGPGHVEVTAGSVAFVSWRGLATLRFEGPSSFEWAAAEPGGALTWRVVSVRALEAELRRGTARLDLPRGWVVDFTCGAYHLRSLADGGTRVDHAAGDPVRITWRGGEAGTLPPLFLDAGQSARLTRPPEIASAPDRSAAAPAWSAAAWPWGGAGVPNRPDLGQGPGWPRVSWPFEGPGGPAPWDEAAWPWSDPEPADEERAPADFHGWGHAPWPGDAATAPKSTADALDAEESATPPAAGTDAVDADDGADEAERSPTAAPPAGPDPGGRSAGPAGPSAGTTEPRPAPPEPQSLPHPGAAPDALGPGPERPAPTPGPSTAYREAPADGSRSASILRRGPLRIRPHPELVIEQLPNGHWRAHLPAEAAGGPAQVVGERIDLWIDPGGAITVDAEGGLLYHDGPVAVRAGTAGGR